MSLIAEVSYANTYQQGTQVVGQVNILILDANTGQPANGNGSVVTYSQNINGVITTQEVTIVGQSFPIWTGTISDSSNGYHTNFTILSLVPGAGGGNTGTCDLEVIGIGYTSESAAGANDGGLTVTASSSNGPIQYSLDNTTFQTSPTFSGLAGGSGTVYLKDALSGCAASSPYFVPEAKDLLVSDPSIDLGNGNISRWNAAFNPIYFIYQRKDFEIVSIGEATDGSGNVLVTVNSNVTGVTTGSDDNINGIDTHISGDLVYIKTTNYEGTYEVASFDPLSPYQLTLVCPFVANDGIGFININSLRPGYKIQTVISYVDPISGKFSTITANNYPLPNGYCQCDFKSFLQSLLQVKDLSNYTLVNYRDMQLSASYQVKYAELWTGIFDPNWITLPNPYYVLFTAMQLQAVGGGNMREYVPFQAAFQLAKWVVDFINPVYNGPGFPFDLGFIFSEYMVGLAPFYKLTLLDINMNPLADQSIADAYLLNETGTFLLQEDAGKFIIAAQALVNTPIVEHVGLNRLLINFNPPALCWYFKVQIQYTAGATTYDLMQPIICRIDQNTTDRPVYLRWIGLTGSWNYYKFVYNQEVGLEVTNAVIKKELRC